MSMDEREFYEERSEAKKHTLMCPHCREENEYSLTWLVRRKRKDPPRGMDDEARARFAKARSYMVRREDVIACANIRCRKRFEIAGLQSVANVQEVATGTAEERAERIRSAFSRRVGHGA
jgi:hypothetical protein